MKTIREIILNPKNINNEVSVSGWIKKPRKLGSLIFFEIYDRSLSCQIIVESNNKFFTEILSLSKESVISVKGILKIRKQENNKIESGNVEILLTDIIILSKADNPPMLIQDQTDALEEVRLKNRYLDLRRPINQKNIIFRSKFLQLMRTYLHDKEFIEIETPILSKQTPEGASDFIVPTKSGKAYALPQSPQVYKQLLMVSGFLKYFQIAKCFRNENSRLDRQPEFTQLDMEMSFTNEEEIYNEVESMIKFLLKEMLQYDLPSSFEKISYDDAINLYGTDKPDLRFGFKIFDCKEMIAKSKSNIITKILEKNVEIKGIIIDELEPTKKELSNFEKFAKDNGAKGLIFIIYKDNLIIGGNGKSFLEKEIVDAIFSEHKKTSGTLFFICDSNKVCLKALGAIRFESIKITKLVPREKYKFLWIIDWPLFEYDEENKKYSATHHPFTTPTDEYLETFDKNKKNSKARSYDIVLNGFELGGGSIRISNPEIQKKMFQALNLSDTEIEDKFGFLLQAFKFGVPPHGGIALGIDRFLMVLLGTPTIRDVMAFPKNSAGIDLMMDCPTIISDEIWSSLKLKTKD